MAIKRWACGPFCACCPARHAIVARLARTLGVTFQHRGLSARPQTAGSPSRKLLGSLLLLATSMPSTSSPKPYQTGFTCHAWTSPDRSFKAIFPKLSLECGFDFAPGVVIVSDRACRSATASEVKNLRTELCALLNATPDAVVYWLPRPKKEERKVLLAGLTRHPVFFG